MGIGGIYISRNKIISKLNTLRIFISSIILFYTLFANLIFTGAGTNLTLETGTLTKIIVDPLQKNELDGDYIEYIISDYKGNIWKLIVNFSYDENTNTTNITTIRSYTTNGEGDINGAGSFNTSSRIDITGNFNNAGLTIPVRTIKNIKDYNNSKIAVLSYEINLKVKPPQPPLITFGAITRVDEKWQASWTTDIPTNSSIRYSLFSETNQFEESSGYNITHTVILTNMTKSNTIYYYTVVAEDENGYFVRSKQNSFDTGAVAGGVLVRIVVTPDAVSLASGANYTFTAAGFDVNNIPIAITPAWSSSNTTVGTINPTTGVFTAIKTGTTDIKAEDGSVFDTALATVTAGSLIGIKVIPATKSIASGSNFTFTATGLDANDNPIPIPPPPPIVGWNSGNETVGTINATTGNFSANQTGTTTISAQYGNLSSVAIVNVTPGALYRIEVRNETVFVISGMNYTFTAAGFDVNNNNVSITPAWSSSNTTVGTINESTGNFSANQTGTTIINATNGTINGSATAIVIDTTPPASITNLTNITFKPTYINWTWTNPADTDFAMVMLYLNGTFKENVTSPTNYYNATRLNANTSYTISTHTVDTSGNVNYSWVNHTANTSTAYTYVFNFTIINGTMVNPDAAKNDSDGRASAEFTESLTGSISNSENYTYVNSYNATYGTIVNFSNMNSPDSGAFANLTEGQILTNQSNRTLNPAKTITTGTQSGSYNSSNLTYYDGAIDITIPGGS